MSERDKMNTANISPGAEVKVDYFNISYPNSIEYNVDQELLRRGEHSFSSFVVTIPTLFDDEFGTGYTAADALKVSRNSTDHAKVDIKAGIAYIGGRRYKQINDITALAVEGNPNTDDTYYIQLRYTKSTGNFDFYASTSEMSDTSTIKYLTLCSAVWDTTPGEWTSTAFTDLRATNTALPPPVTISGNETSDYILTVQNTNSSLLGLYVDGDVKVGDTSLVRTIDLYADDGTTGGLIIHNSSNSVTLICDNTDRLKVLNNLFVPTATQLGSMTFSSTTVSGITTFDCGANPSFTTSSGDFNWNSENFASVGSISCSSVDASGNVQGSVLISDVTTGTAPLTITSTTKVTNLNADQVDGYDLNQDVSSTASPTFVQVSITNGPTLSSSGIAGASGDDITGFDSISATSLTLTGAISAATSTDTINGLIINSGTITSGTWQGTAIANTYVAGLDQDCKTTSYPTFGGLTLTSIAANPTTSGVIRIGESSEGFGIKDSTASPLGGSLFRIYPDTMGWVLAASLEGIYSAENIYPIANAAYDLGSSTYSWDYIYAQHIRYDVDSLSYDHLDDLAIIDALGPSDKTNPEGVSLIDNSVLPDSIRCEDGFIDAHNYTNLLAGGIKQLHNKVKTQEELIEYLFSKIEEFEKTLLKK